MKGIIKNKYLLVLFLILFISIGYALITSNLSISGTGAFKKNKWDVHFDNLDILKGESLASVAPTVTGHNTTEISYTVNFNTPGDVYKFNVDIVNLGSIDAMVSLIGNTELTEEQQKYAEYTVTYKDGSLIEEKNFLGANSSDTITVTITYKKDIDVDTLSKVESIDFSLGIEYSLAKESDNRKNTSVILNDLSGNGYDGTLIGTKIKEDENGIKYINFDGVDDYVKLPVLPSTINWSDGFIIEFKAKWNSFTNYSRIFDLGNGATDNNIVVDTFGKNDTLRFSVVTYALNIIENANLKNINEFKIEFIKGNINYNLKVYQNGNLVNSFDSPEGISVLNVDRTKNYIGKSNFYGDPYLHGRIYYLKITQADGKEIINYQLN